MFKSGAGAKLRQRAEEKNAAAGFNGPTAGSYDAQGGTPRDAKDVSRGDYDCNVKNTLTQTPTPSKSVKAPIK
jgi:hypothetical protein